MRITRRPLILAGALALLILAGCGMSQSVSSDPPFPSSSLSFAEPSESEEPSAPPPPPADAGVGGTWDGTWVIDVYGNTGDFTMELVQSGDAFSGQIDLINNTDCPSGTVDGALDGSDVTFGWVLSDVTVSFIGTRNGNSMSGTWSSVACSDPNINLTGTWEATKR